MWYRIARSILFSLEPEFAHTVALRQLSFAYRTGMTRLLRPQLVDDPVTCMGLRFPNPVGLAAGLDKDGAFIDALAELGFGFIEVGTVTPRPQPGNPKPRLFRLPQAQALINRFGFNSAGIDVLVANVEASQTFSARGGVIGVNIGKNATTPLSEAAEDYRLCLRRLYPLLTRRPGYVTVNISSPNTAALRSLQDQQALDSLLAALRDERTRLTDHYGKRVPLVVKIAPDLNDADIPRIADSLIAHEIDAVIATNTTVARAGVAGMRHADEPGGLSGSPLRARSTEVARRLAQHAPERLPVIAVGGILTGEHAVEKRSAGACLVQLYTGLIYRGPGLVPECRRALLTATSKVASQA
ncbi:MAG: quinone-dependent dihydroorotate dehydrogenase [Sutterellaceae bacterium]|nr:quinone-dependent dihydroorotate dehydrogenase [Burkholderiaceae bacterium]MCX7901589.1 quinone-dependent dihydroorotate dehydrogenase [Burkholderiaceae bacterium]MDW8429316.1 quinone-dependent dihydroorotate dehydrogenase [Sutterellaceae bacterium]